MTARILARAGAAAAAIAAAVAVAVVTVPALESTPPVNLVVPAALPVVACPGPLAVPVGSVGSGGELGSEPTSRSLSYESPAVVESLGEGASSQAAIAAQMERVDDGDIAGWAALTCGQASNDSWLVGGATSLGSSARLVLTNPSAAPSEANVTLYGPLGQVEATLVVPVGAQSQVDRLLEAVAPELRTLVVRVEATGPGVVAALQDSRLDGFQPDGSAWVAPSQASDRLTIPAAHLGELDASVTVRLMAPEGASVELTLVTEQGVDDWSIGRPLVLEPGVVTDLRIPVDHMSAIEVRADAPVYAAALTRVPRAAAEGLDGDLAHDHTWVPGMPTDAAVTLTAVVSAQGSRAAVYSGLNQQVTFADTQGVIVATADLAARTVTWVDLDVAPGTIVSASGAFAWTVHAQSSDGMVASVSPVDIVATDVSVTVRPATYPDIGAR